MVPSSPLPTTSTMMAVPAPPSPAQAAMPESLPRSQASLEMEVVDWDLDDEGSPPLFQFDLAPHAQAAVERMRQAMTDCQPGIEDEQVCPAGEQREEPTPAQPLAGQSADSAAWWWRSSGLGIGVQAPLTETQKLKARLLEHIRWRGRIGEHDDVAAIKRDLGHLHLNTYSEEAQPLAGATWLNAFWTRGLKAMQDIRFNPSVHKEY